MDEHSIFIELLEIEDPDQRRQRLAHRVGDDAAMRSRIEGLLDAHGRASKFMETSAEIGPGILNHAAAPSVRGEQPGDRIGPYKLLQQIGEGGMGVVYMAEQSEPVRRKVALKIVKAGMDSRQVIARFEAERQALAMMNHPNVAKVLDAGATETGRPYFVMELVRGIPITEFCDTQKLTLNERMELFIKVCQAVHHAHQKGIIHRDLKPSNLLVELHDVRPVPKVIDFGIAKATDQKLTDKTLFTSFAQLIGTPMYMSPEQAQMSGLDIDVRSDIYSLGVLLYELLTGTTPVSKETLDSVGYDELRRMISEQEPPRPSGRISTLKAEAKSTLATNRRSNIPQLATRVRGDLDWVAAKALEKDRARRYQSASEFAHDVQQFLDGEPVEAHPPSMLYRLRKLARRNRVAIVTTFLVAIALLLGSGVSVLQALKANKQARLTKAEANRAEETLRLAMEAVNVMYMQEANSMHLTPKSQESRKEILEKALNYYIAFAKTNSNRELRHETATAWRRVGEIYHRFEENDRAIEALLMAIDILHELADEFPHDPSYRQGMASAFWYLSKPLEVMNRFEEGEEHCRTAIQLQTKLVEEYPEVLEYVADLAISYHQLGHLQVDSSKGIEAFSVSREHFIRLAEMEPEQLSHVLQLGHVHSHLGRLLHAVGEIMEAEDAFRDSIELVGDVSSPSDADVVNSGKAIVGGVYQGWGTLLREKKSFVEAVKAHSKSVQAFKTLSLDFPTVNYYRSQLGISQIELAKSLRCIDRETEARDVLEEAGGIFAELEKQFPSNPEYRKWRKIANALRQQGGAPVSN